MDNVLKMEMYKRNQEKQKLSKLLKSIDTHVLCVSLSSTAAFTTFHRR